ncbi:MAG: DUF2723 domain-containing protein [Chloroflexota bacterium]|nr:DUF2723 domain-containing protein [Chloroflexota bacterium]
MSGLRSEIEDLKSYEHLLLGLGVGLYLSRVLAERATAPRPWPAALGLGVACVASTIALLSWARRLRCDLRPLAICYGYALWPKPHPPLALAVGLIALLGLAIANIQAKGELLTEGLIFLGSLALYLCTLAPTLLPADAGEFQFVAPLLGVAHPPGYPLYTLLGKLFTLIPLGDPAYRVNLLSAFAGSLTLALVGWSVRQLTPSPWPGLAAALALGGATTFWAQATRASIRGLTALFTALILGLALAYGRTRAPRHLTALGLAFGLGITHHPSLGFLALPVGVYLILADRTLVTHPRKLLRPLAAAFLGLSALLYLPIRDAMGAPQSPGDLTTLRGFLEHVTARGFRGDMFAFARLTLLPDRLVVLKEVLLMQFGGPLLLAILIGGILLLWRNPKAFLLLGGAFVLSGFVAITYRAPQTVEYLMPAYVCLALLLGGGMGALLTLPMARAVSTALAIAFVLYLGTAQVLAHYPSFALLHHDRSARTYAEEVLQSAPPQAIILANWHHFTPLRYLQVVEGQRPDVTISYTHPRGGIPLPDLWREEIDRHIREGPVIVTRFYPQFEDSPYRFRPLGDTFLVRAEPSFDPPSGFTPLNITLSNKVKLIGYRLERAAIGPGQPLELSLAWRPLTTLEKDCSLFVHLVGEDGVSVAQADSRHAAGRYKPREVLIDRHTLFLRPAVPPGDYTLIVGAYTPLADGDWKRMTTLAGADHVALAQVKACSPSLSPITLHRCHQPFVGGITLLGVDYDTSYPHSQRVYLHWHLKRNPAARIFLLSEGQPVCRFRLPENSSVGAYLSTACDIPIDASSIELLLRRAGDGEPLPALGPWHLPRGGEIALPTPQPGSRYLSLGGKMALVGARVGPGDPISVRLDFVALRPLTHDYTLSLRLRDLKGRWQVQEDGTPAWGAIPTLKWIRSTWVSDIRRISPPADAVLGQAQLELLVYDAFTMAPLPPLDERLLAQGPLISLGQLREAELR